MLKIILNSLIQMIKGERSFTDVWYFIQGHIREMLYFSKYDFLIRKHIREQIDVRINTIREVGERGITSCLKNEQCDICGCYTYALIMSNKSCEGNCYPGKFFSKNDWEHLKEMEELFNDKDCEGVFIYDDELWKFEKKNYKYYYIKK